MRGDARAPFVALTIPREAGGSVGRLLSSAMSAALNSGRGEVTALERRPWTAFGEARGLVPSPDDDRRPQLGRELVEERLAQVEAIAARVELRHRQAVALDEPSSGGCRELAWATTAHASGKRLSGCAAAARERQVAELEALPECRDAVQALSRFEQNDACRATALRAGDLEDPALRDDTYAPVRLSAREGRGLLPTGAALAVDDGALLSTPSHPLAAGDGSDREGRGGFAACATGVPREEREGRRGEEEAPARFDPARWDGIEEREAVPAGGERGGDAEALLEGAGLAGLAPPSASEAPAVDAESDVLRVNALIVPHSVRRWSFWRQVLRFWRRPPAPRVIYRGVLEVVGGPPPLPQGFGLSPEAERLAREAPGEFRALCGTHYVSQVIGRRGVVFYFTLGSPGDREIAVLPFGLGGGALRSTLLAPATVRDFFDGMEVLARLLGDGDAALPVGLVLEPWSEYLRSRGLRWR